MRDLGKVKGCSGSVGGNLNNFAERGDGFLGKEMITG